MKNLEKGRLRNVFKVNWRNFIQKWLRTIRNFFTPALSILLAFVIAGVLIQVLYEINPLLAYETLLVGAFGSLKDISETLLKSIPLMLIALGYLIAFKGRVFSLGGDGQVLIGALIGTLIGLLTPNTPLFLVLLFGFLGGAFYGGIAGFLKAKWGVSEIVSTVMLNYIAFYLVTWAVSGPLRDPQLNYSISAALPASALLPRFPGSRLNIFIIITPIIAVLIYFLFSRTTIGYQIRAVGTSPKAARYGGISSSKIILFVMIISGGLSGLAGIVEISGIHLRVTPDFSPGIGYTAIIVALLGDLNPFGIVLSSIFFGAMITGGNAMAFGLKIPVFFSSFLQALVLFFYLAGKSGNFKSIKKYLFKIWRR